MKPEPELDESLRRSRVFEDAVNLPDFWERLRPYCFRIGPEDRDLIGTKATVWVVTADINEKCAP